MSTLNALAGNIVSVTLASRDGWDPITGILEDWDDRGILIVSDPSETERWKTFIPWTNIDQIDMSY